MESVLLIWSYIIIFSAGSEAVCCNYGTSSVTAGQSCLDIIRLAPGCKGISGYYWIDPHNTTAVQVYCDMSILGGGWERVAYYDSKVDNTCPGNMLLYIVAGHHLCRNDLLYWSNFRHATYYPVTKSYSQVRGLVRGYAYGQDISAFLPFNNFREANHDYTYMDGISISYQEGTSIYYYKHIHSFAVSDLSFAITPYFYQYTCYIAGQNNVYLPSLIGNDHYCHSLGLPQRFGNGYFYSTTTYFGDNWDGTCTNSEYCRDVRRYFIKTIPKEMISADHRLMVRVMSHPTNLITMSFLDLYVR